MTTYDASSVSDAVIAFRKPITLQQGRGLRDNMIASFEGASGAPINRAGWHPYDMTINGDGSQGVIYDYSVDGLVATIDTPDFEDGFEYAIMFDNLSHDASVKSLIFQTYFETSASYSSIRYLYLDTVVSTTTISGFCIFQMPRSVKNSFTYQSVAITSNSVVEAISSAVYSATAQKMLRARISWGSSNNDGGTVRLYRRQEPGSL